MLLEFSEVLVHSCLFARAKFADFKDLIVAIREDWDRVSMSLTSSFRFLNRCCQVALLQHQAREVDWNHNFCPCQRRTESSVGKLWTMKLCPLWQRIRRESSVLFRRVYEYDMLKKTCPIPENVWVFKSH